jgi:hypothetical protein
LQFNGGTIRAEGTFDPFTVMQVSGTQFIIGQNPNALATVNFNNKALSLLAGSLEFKIQSGTTYDTFANLSTWTVAGTQLLLRLINGAENNLAPSDILTLVNAGSDTGVFFANVPSGTRLTTADGLGSFLVSYPAGSGDLILSDFQPVPEPKQLAIATTLGLAALIFVRRLRHSPHLY